MERIVTICLTLIIVLVAYLAGTTAYTAYTENAYRNSLEGTLAYMCTITTDAPLYNVTFFLPVPADRTGNSPVVSAFSAHRVSGIPGDWDATLFDTGKATLIKVVAPAIVPPPQTTKDHPYTITLSSESAQRSPLVTRDTVGNGAIFRPVQGLTEYSCTRADAGRGSRCFSYTTPIFAGYQTAADTTVTITSSTSGKNTWDIFGPQSNEYRTTVSTTLKGAANGWAVMNGDLSEGTGSYDIPAGSPAVPAITKSP